MQNEASVTVYMGRTANERKVTKWLSFKKKCKSERLKKYDHIQEVSMNIYMDRRAYKRKVPKWLPFENYKLE